MALLNEKIVKKLVTVALICIKYSINPTMTSRGIIIILPKFSKPFGLTVPLKALEMVNNKMAIIIVVIIE